MLPKGYEKRSFLKLAEQIDSKRLIQEYQKLPQNAWGGSYWKDVHCSVDTILLRGGNNHSESDYISDIVSDSPLLYELDYIKALISENGPFGYAKYVFIFKMAPNGISRLHRDLAGVWKDMYRIHIPIITNSEAFLVADGKSMHLSPGAAWTFDNQSLHGAINGAQERIHLIFDVSFNQKLQISIDQSEFFEGKIFPEHLKAIKPTY